MISAAVVVFVFAAGAETGSEIRAEEAHADEPSSSVKSDGGAAGVGNNDEQPPNKNKAMQVATHRPQEVWIMV